MRRSVAVESVSPPVSSIMTGTFQELPITDIHESVLLTNPRATFDQDALDELAASIRLHGVLQPILVRPRSVGGAESRWPGADKGASVNPRAPLIFPIVVPSARPEGPHRRDPNPGAVPSQR